MYIRIAKLIVYRIIKIQFDIIVTQLLASTKIIINYYIIVTYNMNNNNSYIIIRNFYKQN